MLRNKIAFIFLIIAITMSCLPVKNAEAQTPIKGPLSTIVILVEFPDLAHRTQKATIQALVFEGMNSYYKEVSYGKVWITGTITDWISIPKSFTVYLKDQGDGKLPIDRLAPDAIGAADAVVNFRDYPYVLIVAPGSGWGSAQTSLKMQTNDGVRVDRAAVAAEPVLAAVAGDIMNDDMRSVVHEFGHLLGLPDLYNRALKKGDRPNDMGFWDIMASGFVHPSAWTKIKLGWIEKGQILDLGKGQVLSVTVEPAEKDTKGILVLQRLVTAPSEKNPQYYLIEVRQRIGFDSNLYDTGVLVMWADALSKIVPVTVKDADPSTNDLNAFDIGPGENRIFLDEKNDFAVVLLSKVGSAYRVHVTTSGKANAALQTWSLIEDANGTVARMGWGPDSVLDASRQLLKRAIDTFDSGNYEQANAMAREAKDLAERANVSTTTSMVTTPTQTIDATNANTTYAVAIIAIVTLAAISGLVARRIRRRQL